MKTLYVAKTAVWGSTFPKSVYFETRKERDDYVRTTDYTDKAGTIKITDEQYDEWNRFGEFRSW